MRRLPTAICRGLAVAGWLATALAGSAGAEADLRSAIESARRAVETSTLDEVQRQLASTQLDVAAAHEREAEEFRSRAASLRAETADQPERVAKLRELLARDLEPELAEWEARLPSEADDETLERVLEQERDIIGNLRARIDQVSGELARTLSRPAQAASEIAELRNRAELLAAPTAALEGEPPLLTEARSLARQGERRRLRAELDLRLVEQDTAAQRQRLHELELRELRLQREQHVRRVALLQRRIAALRRSELESLVESLAEQEASLVDAPAPLSEVASQNRALGEELEAQNEQLARDRAKLAAFEESRGRTALVLSDSVTRLEVAGASEAVGLWLWGERRRLESPARLRQQLEQLRGLIAELSLRLVVVNEQQRELLEPAEAAETRIETSQLESEEAAVAVAEVAALVPVLRQQAELYARLEPLLQRRLATLGQSETALLELGTDSLTLQQLLDRHLLWTPSHPPIGPGWLERVPEGLRDLVKPARFLKTLELSLRAVRAQPLPWIGSVIALLVAFELRRRAPPRIAEQARVTRQIREDGYRATASAFGWTLLAALPGPLALALLGWLLQSIGNPGRYSDSLGRATGAIVAPLLAVQLLRWSSIDGGLGQAHFRWSPSRRAALGRWSSRAAIVVLPAYFVTSLAFVRNLELPNDVQARIAVAIAGVALAWTLWKLLEDGQVWDARPDDRSTLRWGLRLGLPALSLAVTGLALRGYVYSAGVLMQALLASFALAVAVALLEGLVARWFLFGQQQLALRRREEARSAAAQAATASDVPHDPESDLSLGEVDAQTRRLLRALRLGLLALGLVAVWADVLPAIGRLDEIALWHFADTGEDGAAIRVAVTLKDALYALIALALTAIGARNLPGLVEIALLSGRFVDAASRYAITSVLRYSIVIAGTLTGLSLFGLRWSQLQWLAAALTVGLGFGLQEIFANFVSGLILLFERPFRVGDVITVDSLSGRVTRIRTRATTIVDFDNKEIVVPNKNFITGQLVNWTLSDATTRITVQVGVAYGTEPDRVHELLQQAARENPRVLGDPAPMSLFLAFGASSLDFELRVFVGTVEDRLQVKDQLNRSVARLFAENDIEIAFPQLDLHVRDVPSGEPDPVPKP